MYTNFSIMKRFPTEAIHSKLCFLCVQRKKAANETVLIVEHSLFLQNDKSYLCGGIEPLRLIIYFSREKKERSLLLFFLQARSDRSHTQYYEVTVQFFLREFDFVSNLTKLSLDTENEQLFGCGFVHCLSFALHYLSAFATVDCSWRRRAVSNYWV